MQKLRHFWFWVAMGGQGFSELCSVALDGECWLNFGSHALLCATLDQLCCRLLHLSSQQQQQLPVQIFKKIVTESVKFPQERYTLFWFHSSTSIEVFVVWSSTTSLPVIHPLRTFLESHHGCKLPDPNPPPGDPCSDILRTATSVLLMDLRSSLPNSETADQRS